MQKKKILLIITGSIAAYKSLDLIRKLENYDVSVVLTESAKHFVTPLSVAAISKNNVYDDLFLLKDEVEMGHIRLSREADVIIVAPATADIMAKVAHGHANDLASTILLASDKKIFIVPAMNEKMWAHPAVQHNVKLLIDYGIEIIEPQSGSLACGEYGIGRMCDIETIAAELKKFLK